MRNALLIIGIISVVACVLSLLYAGLNLFGYHNVRDGSAGLYARLHQKAITFAVIGVILAAAGAACLIIRVKI